MKSLLIAQADTPLRQAMYCAFSKDYRVILCADGCQALAALRRETPDAMILDLALPCIDGLTLLRKAPALPSAILALSAFLPDFVFQEARELGVAQVLLLPCSIDCITDTLTRLIRYTQQSNSSPSDPQSIATLHLQRLKLSPSRSGYRPLQIGIPLYAQDPKQSLSKELYPAVARICRLHSSRSVGKSMERCIKAAWETRDEILWESYFPDSRSRCPRNREFLSSLARKLQE